MEASGRAGVAGSAEQLAPPGAVGHLLGCQLLAATAAFLLHDDHGVSLVELADVAHAAARASPGRRGLLGIGIVQADGRGSRRRRAAAPQA